MKLHTLPIVAGLFVFVVVLSGVVYMLGDNDTQARDTLGLARAVHFDFSALEVGQGTSTIRVEASTEGWSVAGEPIDEVRLRSFRQALDDASVQLVSRSGRSNAVYGLMSPKTLTFIKGDTRTTFELGAVAYTTGGIYVARPGEDAVYLVTESDELSALSLSTVESWKMQRATSTVPAQAVSVP